MFKIALLWITALVHTVNFAIGMAEGLIFLATSNAFMAVIYIYIYLNALFKYGK